MHSRSTGLAQLFHSALAVALIGCLATAAGRAQAALPDTLFRVFLRSGDALPALAEPLALGDRLVLSLWIGGPAPESPSQLVSVPAASVDLDRTMRYSAAVRAAHFGATRGEAEFADLTSSVQRDLDVIADLEDSPRRLEVAEAAKKRLIQWSRDHYFYRAHDIVELAALFDEVIVELRVASGESRFAIDLRTGLGSDPPPPLLPVPSARERVALALVAAGLADVGDERLGVVRAALAASGPGSGLEDLAPDLRRRLAAEERAERAYFGLANDILGRIDLAKARADPRLVHAAAGHLAARDLALGRARPSLVSTLERAVAAALEAIAVHVKALEAYAAVRPARLGYERRIRPVLSGLDGLAPVLGAVRDLRFTDYGRLVESSARLDRLRAVLHAVSPPAELADVHTMLDGAVVMAQQALARRRLAVTTLNLGLAREASTAAGGAALLSAEARHTLVARLYPPKLQ
jgi:hypothetical protein